MSHGSMAAEATVSLAPSRDERLVPYILIGVGALAATVLTAQPALAALAVPFMLALAVGLRITGRVAVSARLDFDARQVLEGDAVEGRLELRWPAHLGGRLLLHRPHGIARSTDGEPAEWDLPPGVGAVSIPFRLEATRWGKRPIAEVWVSLSAPFGLLTWTGRVLSGPPLRVLPASERLTRLLEPAQSRAVIGMHISERRGSGTEFAELRPYTPGDRLRDLNWSATARYRTPFVNRHHRELSGDVVITLDAFGDGSAGSTEALARAARAGWALATVHLQVFDRVGLATLGSRTRWLPPAGGARAKYRLLETLLDAGGDLAGAFHGEHSYESTTVPAGALIIALTHLHDIRTVHILQGWRARGRSVAVAMIDIDDLLGPPRSSAETLARRLWAIELERRKEGLTTLGIPVVALADGAPVAPFVSAMRRARRTLAVAVR